MVKRKTYIATFIFLFYFSLSIVFAQNGVLAGKSASLLPKKSSDFKVNAEAWNSFVSGNTTRMFGTWKDQNLICSIDYESQLVNWGKKVANDAMIFEIDWVGPLFGGESYTDLIYVMPFDLNDAQKWSFYGGWEYHLIRMLDIDIGGNFLFYNKKIYGPGIPTGNGTCQAGNIYLGFIGKFFLEPSIYYVYDFDLKQTTIQGGLNYRKKLSYFTNVLDKFRVENKLRFAWLSARSWLGGAQLWKANYCYWLFKSDLIYEAFENFEISLGIRYSGNTDTVAPSDFGNFDTSPRNMVWMGTEIKYIF